MKNEYTHAGKMYLVNVPKWDTARRDYNEPCEISEKLYKYPLYSRNEEAPAPLIIFAIGGNAENNFCDNWDIYADEKGTLYSIPRPAAPGCEGTYFGDVYHIKHLIRAGHFSDTLTAYGAEMMKGI